MSEQEKMLQAIEEYRISAANFPSTNKPDFDVWVVEVKYGKVANERLSKWISTLVNYYGEKDRPFAAYLEGLLK